MCQTFLTVFTPTFNRVHTLQRTYESLCRQSCKDFEWLIIDDGSKDNTKDLVESWIRENKISVRYIYKENGGLHTGYTKAFANINTELNVCIDSDDFMPDNGVEIIKKTWEGIQEKDKVSGIIGLDYSIGGSAIGGLFKEPDFDTYCGLTMRHNGDIKIVCRTDLLKKLSPMKVFQGEKNFNPTYYYKQVDLLGYKFKIINKNLCWVDYQPNGMSSQIFYQYRNSPNSFAEFRRLAMIIPFYTPVYRWRNVIHYVSSCIFAKQWNMIKTSPRPWATIAAIPFGVLLNLYIRYKTK